MVPVVWNNRLLLFWLRILKQGPETEQKPPATKPLVELNRNDLPGGPTVKTQAVLCWSEYYNGKWQPTKTSDANLPTLIWNACEVGNLVFKRTGLILTVGERDGALRIGLEYDGGWSSFFLLYNTHSSPVRKEDQPESGIPFDEYYRFADDRDGVFFTHLLRQTCL